MSWFNSLKNKLNSIVVGTAAGEWAVTAMAVMVYADGEVEGPEIEKARIVATTNPVVKNSIGSNRGEQLFNDVINTIGSEPRTMIQSYMRKLDELAHKIDKLDDKNFALAGVIAVASADGEVEKPEYELLQRFRLLLGATIDLPPAPK